MHTYKYYIAHHQIECEVVAEDIYSWGVSVSMNMGNLWYMTK